MGDEKMAIDDAVEDCPNQTADERITRKAALRIAAKDTPKITGDIDLLVAQELELRGPGCSLFDAEASAYAQLLAGQQVVTGGMIRRHEAGLHVVRPILEKPYGVPPGVRYQK